MATTAENYPEAHKKLTAPLKTGKNLDRRPGDLDSVARCRVKPKPVDAAKMYGVATVKLAT